MPAPSVVPSATRIKSGGDRSRLSPPPSFSAKGFSSFRLGHAFGLAFAPGRGEFLELLLAHGFDHRARGALQLAPAGLAALGGQRRARGLLLRLGFRRHVCLLCLAPPCPRTP